MKKGPALVILAAGLGSRYGGFKQIEAIGENNESIMVFSIKDAIRAGFGKIHLVINPDIEREIVKQVIHPLQSQIDISYNFQDICDTPVGSDRFKQRTKPWGTGHAILSARNSIDTPFAVINADDFYGSSAFTQMSSALELMAVDSNEFVMVGYRLANTLSKYGGVSRGFCTTDGEYLSSILEIKEIEESNGQITGKNGDKTEKFEPNSIVSMNFWGFSPNIFKILSTRFEVFLEKFGTSEKEEYFITEALDDAIENGLIKIKVIPTDEKWFGITHTKDRSEVIEGIRDHLR